eukprot:134103_1
MRSIKICILTVVIIVNIILATVQIYALYWFKSIQHLLIIQRRYPKFVIAEAIIVIIFLLFIIPLWSNDILEVTYFNEKPAKYFLFTIVGEIATPMMHLIVCIEAARLWLVSYDLHYLHASENKHWKCQIDESFAQTNWYLKNKHKYGKQKYVLLTMIFYYIPVAAIITTLYVLNFDISHYIDALFYLFVLLFVCYLYYKCRKYKNLNDNFLFFYEFRATTFIWTICICIFGVSIILLLFLNDSLHWITDMIIILNAIVACSIPSLLSVFWIPKKIQTIEEWNDELMNVQIEMSYTKPDIEMEEKTKIFPKHIDTRLYEIFKYENKFETFVQWMYREFSSESVLCFITCVQFKGYMVDCLENDTNYMDYKYLNMFYNNIPESTIVFGNCLNDDTINIETFKNIAHLVYEKYIKYDSELEINIAAKLRKKYIRFDESKWNMESKELINVFDSVIHEMFMFMRNSFIRYERQYNQ